MSMNFKATCEEVHNKEDYYDLCIKTYNGEIKGRFERSQIRHLIEILDNSVDVGLDGKFAG